MRGVVFQIWRYVARESPQPSVLTAVRPLSYAVISTFRTLPATDTESRFVVQWWWEVRLPEHVA